MEKSIHFEEVVTYNHEIIVSTESAELLNEIVGNVQCEIDCGGFEDKEEIIAMIVKGGADKITLIEDDSPWVEINGI